MIEVVRVLIAAGDGENARAKNAAERMGDQQGIALCVLKTSSGVEGGRELAKLAT